MGLESQWPVPSVFSGLLANANHDGFFQTLSPQHGSPTCRPLFITETLASASPVNGIPEIS